MSNHHNRSPLEQLLHALPVLPRPGCSIVVRAALSPGQIESIQLTRIPEGIDWVLSTKALRARFTTHVDGSSPSLLCSDVVNADVRLKRLKAALAECQKFLIEALGTRPQVP